jgi:hypothetical protein
MALIDCSIDRDLTALVQRLPHPAAMAALRGGNPKMADIVAQLDRPGFSRKLNIATLTAALKLVKDVNVLEVIERHDGRDSARSAVWVLRRPSNIETLRGYTPEERVASLASIVEGHGLEVALHLMQRNLDSLASPALAEWYKSLDPVVRARLVNTLHRCPSVDVRRAILDDVLTGVTAIPASGIVFTSLVQDYDGPITVELAQWATQVTNHASPVSLFERNAVTDGVAEVLVKAQRFDLMLVAGFDVNDVKDAAAAGDTKHWPQMIKSATDAQCDVLIPALIEAQVRAGRMDQVQRFGEAALARQGLGRDTVVALLSHVGAASAITALCDGPLTWTAEELSAIFSAARSATWVTSGGAILRCLASHDRTAPALTLAEVLLEYGDGVFEEEVPGWTGELIAERLLEAFGDDEQAWAVAISLMGSYRGSVNGLVANVSAVMA